MKIKILKSEEYSFEDCDMFAGRFINTGWITTIMVMEDHKGTMVHGNRDKPIMGDAGKVYELVNSRYDQQPELKFRDFLTQEAEPCEIVEDQTILNLTQHTATPEQGCSEPENKAAVQAVLTFDSIPTVEEMQERAIFLANICKDAGSKRAMIGGAPFFMSTLEKVLIQNGIQPLYAFSERVSVESVSPDGTVTKTNVFKHVGWIEI